MHRLPTLSLRLAELRRMRDEYLRLNKAHLLDYIDHVIADAEHEIEAIERTADPATAAPPRR